MAFSLYVDLLKSFPALEEIMKLKYLLGGGGDDDADDQTLIRAR